VSWNEHTHFTTIDPLLASGRSANPQSFNRYVYAGNNPIPRSDPTGEDWIVEVVKGTVGKNEVNVERPVWLPKGDVPSDIPRAPSIWETNYGGKGFQALDPNSERSSEVFKTREEAQAWLHHNVGDARVHALSSAISQGADEAATGLAKGTGNFGIETLNFLTQPGGMYGSALGIPNPFRIEPFEYESPREAKFGSGARVGLAAGTFFAARALVVEPPVSAVPEINITRNPAFLGQANGPSIALPNGASPTAVVNRNGSVTGFAFTGGRGGAGLSDSVTGVRIMNPTSRYPSGYVTYMGNGPQGIHPVTGRTIPNSDWWRHIPLNH